MSCSMELQLQVIALVETWNLAEAWRFESSEIWNGTSWTEVS